MGLIQQLKQKGSGREKNMNTCVMEGFKHLEQKSSMKEKKN
jgi:hypothetical protein